MILTLQGRKERLMKAKLALACAEIIPLKYQKELAEIFRLHECGRSLSEEEISGELSGAVGLALGGLEKISLQVLKESSTLKWIVFVGIQAESFFTAEAWRYCLEQGIPVYQTGGGIEAVARFTVKEIFDFFEPEELAKKSITVIGAGNIGSRVLSQLKGKCRKLRYADPLGEKNELRKMRISYLPEYSKAFQANIVSLHLALAPETEGSIGLEHLKLIKRGGLLINNARAGLVEAEVLRDFLKARPDVSALWDVFYLEGEEYERFLADKRNEVLFDIIRSPNFRFTKRLAAWSDNSAFNEYGNNLLRIIKEKKLALA